MKILPMARLMRGGGYCNFVGGNSGGRGVGNGELGGERKRERQKK